MMFAGLDLGTSGCRAVVLDRDGARVAMGERAWASAGPVTPPAPAALLEAARGALADAAAACDARAIEALGVCSQRTGAAFIDAAGDEIAISHNTDAGGVVHGTAQDRAHGDRIYAVTGKSPAMLFLPARLAWVREHEARAVASALPLSDWLVWRLTGERATEPTQAADTACFDLARGTWSEELLGALDVERALLPEVGEPGAPVGGLNPGWSLPAGTPVVAAGADTACAALGAGATGPGQAIVVAGTTMLAQQVIDAPGIDPDGRLWTSPAASPGGWVHEAHCGEAGSFIAWVAGLLGTDPAGLAAMAEAGQPGAGGAMFCDAQAGAARDFPLLRRGVLTFPAPVLALGRPREDVARAAFESVAFAAREGLGWLTARDGRPAAVVATGGVARSGVFRAALAGACERPVRVTAEATASARGAAIAAAAHLVGGFEQARAALHDHGTEVAPRAADGYPAHYERWRALSDEVRASTATTKGLIG